MKLIEFLEDRIRQLEDRKFMIPKYVEYPLRFLGRKDFTLDEIPKIQHQILECKAAIKAVKEFNRLNSEQGAQASDTTGA